VSTRLAATLAIPIVGLLFLLGGLAYLTGEVGVVEYRGRPYEESASTASTAGFVPTEDRIGDRQVFVPARQLPGPPPAILLQAADGEFVAYRLKADK
jgi:hypothetical protein